tara:strand:- start:11784 stop:12281 length:498 start_codon:yes stop_codon:yes gene_type:complete
MKIIFSLLLIGILATSCGIYSFTGASIPTEAETVSVTYFTSTATNLPATLNQTITEGLRDLLLSQTSLDLIESNGDLDFNGTITKYQLNPMAIQANETAGKNRLTIAVEVEYNNRIDKNQNFKTIFNRYRDFDSSENLTDVEGILIEEISNELLEDIFNKAFVNW